MKITTLLVMILALVLNADWVENIVDDFSNTSTLALYGDIGVGIQEQNSVMTLVPKQTNDSIRYSPTRIFRKLPSFTTSTIMIGLRFKFIHVEFENLNYQESYNVLNYNPFQIDYYSRIFFKFTNLEFGLEHLCGHSIVGQAYEELQDEIKWNTGHNKFYIKTNWELNLIK